MSHGVDATFIVDCKNCQDAVTWDTQPEIRSTRLNKGNLDTMAAVILAGNTYQDLKDIAENANLKIMGKDTFYKHAKAYVYPAIDSKFKYQQRRLMEVKEKQQEDAPDSSLTLAMDCRFSRPGYTATYAVTSAVDVDTGKVLAHSVKSKTDQDVTSSKEMETVGTKIILKSLMSPHTSHSPASTVSTISNNATTPSTSSFDIPSPPCSQPIRLRVGTVVTDDNASVAAMIPIFLIFFMKLIRVGLGTLTITITNLVVNDRFLRAVNER